MRSESLEPEGSDGECFQCFIGGRVLWALKCLVKVGWRLEGVIITRSLKQGRQEPKMWTEHERTNERMHYQHTAGARPVSSDTDDLQYPHVFPSQK